MPSTEGDQACAVCGRVLSHRTSDAGQQDWIHPAGEGDDHPVVPVPWDQVRVRPLCDFCRGEPVTHEVPAASFLLPISGGSDGDWAACTPCANLIRRNRWGPLTHRVRESMEARHGPMAPEMVTILNVTYARLRIHMTGPVRPYQPPWAAP